MAPIDSWHVGLPNSMYRWMRGSTGEALYNGINFSGNHLMRTPSAKAKPAPSLRSVINATKKLWRQYHLSYDQHATGADHQAGISASPPALCADDTARTRDADRAVSNVSWTLKA